MHVGHLRSTVHRRRRRPGCWSGCGHDVVRANHLGDWGTPFGMLIEHLLDVGEAEAADFGRRPRRRSTRRRGSKFDADERVPDRARRRVVALQSGDPETLRLWRLLVDESRAVLPGRLRPARRHADRGRLRRRELLQRPARRPWSTSWTPPGLLRDSDGALCVFPAGFTGRDGEPLPIIVRKSDGGFGYGATDLAAIRYRARGARRDPAALRRRPAAAPALRDGVRGGARGRLAAAAVPARARRLRLDPRRRRQDAAHPGRRHRSSWSTCSTRRSPGPRPGSREEPGPRRAVAARVAAAVGIGAIKYADLSTDRVKDYVFDWDRMLVARRQHGAVPAVRARPDPLDLPAGRVRRRRPAPIAIAEPAERALALELLAFERGRRGGRRRRWSSTGWPATCTAWRPRSPRSTSAARCCAAEPEVRASRLALCDLTARVLRLRAWTCSASPRPTGCEVRTF